jgi:hypothetical protein
MLTHSTVQKNFPLSEHILKDFLHSDRYHFQDIMNLLAPVEVYWSFVNISSCIKAWIEIESS